MVNNWLTKGQGANAIPPAICFLCEDYVDPGHLVCNPCRLDFAVIRRACPRCGKEVSHANLPCPSCSTRPPRYDHLIAPFHYAYPISLMIKFLKYNNNIELSGEFGRALASAVEARGRPLPEAVVPVPLHPLRAALRGYNQAGEIARVVAAQLRLPVELGMVKRTRHTLPQFNLGPAQRLRNINGAFSFRSGSGCRSVAIVDDVVTTGTTVNELAGLLKQAGLKTVEVWACARAC